MNRFLTASCTLMICAGFVQAAPHSDMPAPPIDIHESQPSEKITYLGVSTMPVPEMLRAHLDLPDRAGILVMFVADDSPAANAGIKRHDVLVKLGDQMLLNHDQLSVLIHARKSGDAVTLHTIHKGQAQSVDVTLGERPIEPPHVMPEHLPPHILEGPPPPFDPNNLNQLERHLRDSNIPEEQFDRLMDEFRGRRDWMQPHPDGGQTHASMTYVDGNHKLTITQEGDSKHLHAETRDGMEIFDGPINTDAQRAEIPREIRKKVKRLEKRSRVHLNPESEPLPDDPEHEPHPDSRLF